MASQKPMIGTQMFIAWLQHEVIRLAWKSLHITTSVHLKRDSFPLKQFTLTQIDLWGIEY